MKIATWNVNSVRQRLPNLLDWLARAQPDVVGLQELKCQDADFPALEIRAAGYEALVVGQKSYNGVALLTKVPAILAGKSGADEQARMLSADCAGVHVINIYAPNGNPVGSEKFTYKLDWMARLETQVKDLLAAETPFVLMGDFNIIPEGHDCYDPAAWAGDALYQPESRAFYRRLINLGLYDAVRMHHPRARAYTFWDYQAGAWPQDMGIRIDHMLLSPQMADRCRACGIDRDERGRDNPSDHVPVWIEIG